ncbi:hypothetical protein EsHS_00003657 [Epichloe bromicola]
MAGDQHDLSHEEVWDDSALIDSWNEALAEYKKYHSIYAKGGSVRDLPQVQDSASSRSASPKAVSAGPEDAQPTETAEQEAATASSAPVAPPPQALLGSSMPF